MGNKTIYEQRRQLFKYVVGITINYRKSDVHSEYSYVAKLNPLRPITSFSDSLENSYARETVILSDVIEGMNNELKKLGLDPIRAPKLFSRSIEKGREAFITEDLRIHGFKMSDRFKGMDLNHALFVVKELGRFHASSLLFEEVLPTKYIPDTFSRLKGRWFDVNGKEFEIILEKMFSSSGEAMANYLKKSDTKYKKCANWLLNYSSTLARHYFNGFNTCDQFEVLIHGDCWTNNMLFRYNEDEIPVDFRFVDLQLSGKASATSDLNYFFFTSLNGDFRRKNLNTLITTYYESFSEVLKRAGKEPPFSYLELKNELYDRKIFGMASGILSLQFTLVQGEDAPDMENLEEDKIDDFLEKQIKTFEKLSKQEGPFKDRYLAIFDEMLETTIFDEV
ncbi:hypothetical protein Avbf_01635 [Armadillidium vulgare]|nr:hypothetical protein Avbf_01635 [Armadillidium vulgare]